MTETRTIEDRLAEVIRIGEAGRDFNPSAISPASMERFERFDWQAFVPVELRELWPELSAETRLALYFVAQNKAYFAEPGF